MDDERIQGQYNSAFEYLRRISVAFEICNEASTSMNSGLWVQGLVVAFKELSTKMRASELSEKLIELKALIQITTNRKNGKPCIDADIYWRLFTFELFLRRVFAEAGLEMKHKPDANHILFTQGV